ncbi:sigma-70 family RNA polymerase sigma factor [Paenibacillus oceani]|uniref:Sigma-70 family RNA polymerase sigma factor n=1 Tax=Paenibacillus oceani TaxID=2772510 RepID=A0A927C6X7_9BACL|nr:sigma-70 family RNA polymerase sigma factor [Paenibacillus oceani]MBD2862499.1 sigma-70 family RNA polymerase sigma factor [Paenibacillus oceani]
MFHSKLAIDAKMKSAERGGDALIEHLISEYQSELLHLAMSYLNDYQLAQDCVQEIFVTAYHKVDPDKDQSALRKWLKVCTVNRCKSMLRSAFWRRIVLWEHDRMKSVLAATKDEYSKLDDTGVLDKVMRLPVKYREMIVLHYYQDMTLQDISAVLKISHEAVKSRLRRAKEQLKVMLEGEDGHE